MPNAFQVYQKGCKEVVLYSAVCDTHDKRSMIISLVENGRDLSSGEISSDWFPEYFLFQT